MDLRRNSHPRFHPQAGFTGNPTPITYTLTENSTGLSDQATVTVKYLGKPVATNDISSNNLPGTSATVLILSNDMLANGSIPTPGNVAIDINLAMPGIQPVLIVPGQGQWSYESITGLLTFTPQPGFTEDPTPISYTLTESGNGVSDPCSVLLQGFLDPTATISLHIAYKFNPNLMLRATILAVRIITFTLLKSIIGSSANIE